MGFGFAAAVDFVEDLFLEPTDATAAGLRHQAPGGVKYSWLVVEPTPLKYYESVGMMVPNSQLNGKIKHVPNHQPARIHGENL